MVKVSVKLVVNMFCPSFHNHFLEKMSLVCIGGTWRWRISWHHRRRYIRTCIRKQFNGRSPSFSHGLQSPPSILHCALFDDCDYLQTGKLASLQLVSTWMFFCVPTFHFLSHNYLLLHHIIVFFSHVLISQPVCPMYLAIWKQQVYLEYTYTLLQFTVQQFCFLHIFSLYRIIPPVLPHIQQIKILFTNCHIQHKLMYSLMMNQKGPTHVGVQCF